MSDKEVIQKLIKILANQQKILVKLAQTMEAPPSDDQDIRYSPDEFGWEERQQQMKEEEESDLSKSRIDAAKAELLKYKAELEAQGLPANKIKAELRRQMFDMGLIPYSPRASEKKMLNEPEFDTSRLPYFKDDE